MTPWLHLHPTGETFIGRIVASQTNIDDFVRTKGLSKTDTPETKPQTVFIVDRSGSMGQWVQRLINIVLPSLAHKYLGLEPSDKIIVITFDTSVQTIHTTLAGMATLPLRSQGSTNMADVFPHLLRNLSDSNPNVRIVAVSDGAVWDTNKTLAAAEAAAVELQGRFSISATAVRLFTSASQPDTRALASILQLSTQSAGSVIDVNTDPNGILEMADAIGEAADFGSIAGGPNFTLTADNPCLRDAPWGTPTTTLRLGALKPECPVSFWLDTIPNNPTINGVPLDIKIDEPVTQATLEILLEDKINYFLQHMRVLTVVGSQSSKEKLQQIVEYFKNLEDSLPPAAEDLVDVLQDTSLRARTRFMKASLARRLRSVTHAMETIANDDRVNKLNSAQQADYLRQTSVSKSRTARGLARRAVENGTDFEAVMRAEIIAMAAHFESALGDIDDSDHAVSFYSQATTLEGIRCMVELAQDMDILENLTAPQMLRLFNIVGIPAVGPVGDYPDPMTYRLSKLLYGTYVSVADISMVLNAGGRLVAPGTSEAIINAVPVFENRKIQTFLKKYARSSMEYLASVGMRRMIAEVPKTYPHTMCAGIWKLIEDLDNGKEEVKIQHLNQLVYVYEYEMDGCFEAVAKFVEVDADPTKAFNFGDAGISQLVAPVLRLVRTGSTDLLARISRAVYSRETCLALRRPIRESGAAGRQVVLDDLLGVDLSDKATPLPPLFQRNGEPDHCSEVVVNASLLEKYTKSISFLHYITLLKPIFSALILEGEGDFVQRIKAIPKMTTASIVAALQLAPGMSLDEFMLYNVVEALMYSDKPSRVDKVTNKPKLGDLGHDGVGRAMLAGYVRSRYAADYEQRLKEQLGQEQRILQDELIDMLLEADGDDFADLLTTGHARGAIAVQIDKDNSPGFTRLHDALLDLGTDNVVDRAAKLYMIYSGRTMADEHVFNGGNLMRSDWGPLQKLLSKLGNTDVWDRLQAERASRGHVYRGFPNRHGHSNDFPSYFAFGCLSLDEYHQRVDTETWNEYARAHCNCCGVNDFIAKKNAAAFTR